MEHHEHKKIGSRDEIVSYTAKDIPADPVNLRVHGTADHIGCAMAKAGWARADNVSVRSATKIAGSVVLQQAYSAAPVSSLFLHDRIQDRAFERTRVEMPISGIMSASGRSLRTTGLRRPHLTAVWASVYSRFRSPITSGETPIATEGMLVTFCRPRVPNETARLRRGSHRVIGIAMVEATVIGPMASSGPMSLAALVRRQRTAA